jgi:hypothetical protein
MAGEEGGRTMMYRDSPPSERYSRSWQQERADRSILELIDRESMRITEERPLWRRALSFAAEVLGWAVLCLASYGLIWAVAKLAEEWS